MSTWGVRLVAAIGLVLRRQMQHGWRFYLSMRLVVVIPTDKLIGTLWRLGKSGLMMQAVIVKFAAVI